MTKRKWQSIPKPDKQDSRICFGIVWYYDEATADKAGKIVRERGDTYNGGWFHGSPCGRDEGFDYTDDSGRKLYAVTIG